MVFRQDYNIGFIWLHNQIVNRLSDASEQFQFYQYKIMIQQSKEKQIAHPTVRKQLNFQFGLSLLEETIFNNFTVINEMFADQQNQITELKGIIDKLKVREKEENKSVNLSISLDSQIIKKRQSAGSQHIKVATQINEIKEVNTQKVKEIGQIPINPEMKHEKIEEQQIKKEGQLGDTQKQVGKIEVKKQARQQKQANQVPQAHSKPQNQKSNSVKNYKVNPMEVKSQNAAIEIQTQIQTRDYTEEIPNVNIHIHQPQPVQQANPLRQYFVSENNTQENTLSKEQMQNFELMQSKILELSEKVRELEFKESNAARINLKNFNQIEYAIQNNVKLIEKNTKTHQNYEEEIQKLRNQFEEYKLKKEARILKMAHSGNTNNQKGGSSHHSQALDYIIEKVQYLLKYVYELQPKRQFQEDRNEQNLFNEATRKRFMDTVNQKQFNESLKNLQMKIYKNVVKYIKNIQKSQGQGDDEQNILQDLIDQSNEDCLNKIIAVQSKITQIIQDIGNTNKQMARLTKMNQEEHSSIHDKLVGCQSKIAMNEMNTKAIQKYLTDMNKSYNQKFADSENQIADLQQSLEKVNNHIKFYKFTTSGSKTEHTRTAVNGSQEFADVGEERQSGVNANAELQNQVATLKKKLNKLTLKVQNYKEELQAVRDDFSRENDGLKLSIEKKSDWESLRKSIAYFDERIKEIHMFVNQMAESLQKEDKDESTAAKKGWTCLCCDKNIKSYEGKISQVKFSSLFPVRDSPRIIGGYYKQQQLQKQYKQVYLTNNLGNNSKRRISSLKSKESKQELN